VPRALAAGAELLTGTDARRLMIHRRRVRGVETRFPDGSRVDVKAPRVIVAAGTIHTPLLLGASGIDSRSGQLGRNLSLHPATAAVALMDEVRRDGARRPAELLRR